MKKLERVRSKAKEIYGWVCSILAVLALNCKMEYIDGGGISGLRHSFYSYNFVDVFLMAAIFLLIRHVREQGGMRDNRWVRIFSLLLSVSYIVSLSYCKYDSAVFLLGDQVQMLLAVMCIIGYDILIYYTLCLLIMYLERSRKEPARQDRAEGLTNRHVWITAFIIMLLCWLPWILMNYPGTDEPDSVNQMKQFLGDREFNAHHPPLSTFIMGSLFVIGRSVWDANFGFFLYILLQTILGALIFSWSIYEIHKLGVRGRYCILATLYYAVLPMWGGTMQGDGKDILYAEFVVFFVTCLVRIIVTRQCGRKESILLIAASILTALLRNNGIYAVLPTILLLVCYLKNAERKKMCVVLGTVALVYWGVTKVVYPGMGIEAGSVREALSIPFLQTARYVNEYEEEVTAHEREVIDSVLAYDSLKAYDPKHSDSIKNTYKNDDSKLPEYFKIWFQMFLKHPSCYISAALNSGGGYMAPVMVGFPAPIGIESDEYFSGLGVEHVFKDRFADFFVKIELASMEMPVIRYFCMAGSYTWIVLICVMLLLRERLYSGIILFMPEIMNVLVCIASPTWHIRYALPVMAVVPLMIGWTYFLFLGRGKVEIEKWHKVMVGEDEL